MRTSFVSSTDSDFRHTAPGKGIDAGMTDQDAVNTFVVTELWFSISAGNMWVDVAKAGYSSDKEEFPIFLLIFSLDVAIALFVLGENWGGLLTVSQQYKIKEQEKVK